MDKQQKSETTVAAAKAEVVDVEVNPPLFRPSENECFGKVKYIDTVLSSTPEKRDAINNYCRCITLGEVTSPWVPVRTSLTTGTIIQFFDERPTVKTATTLTKSTSFIRVLLTFSNDKLKFKVETRTSHGARTLPALKYSAFTELPCKDVSCPIKVTQDFWCVLLGYFNLNEHGEIQFPSESQIVTPDLSEWVYMLLFPVTGGINSRDKLTYWLQNWIKIPVHEPIIDFTSCEFLKKSDQIKDLIKSKVLYYQHFKGLGKLDILARFYSVITLTWNTPPIILGFLTAVNSLTDDHLLSLDSSRFTTEESQGKKTKRKKTNLTGLLQNLIDRNHCTEKNFGVFRRVLGDEFITALAASIQDNPISTPGKPKDKTLEMSLSQALETVYDSFKGDSPVLPEGSSTVAKAV